FQLNPENYVDTAGIVLGDGTPMILSWNKNCPVSDPDTVEKGQTTACISGIYDLNGSKGPNKFGKDIIGFNGANLWIDFAGLMIGTSFTPTPIKPVDYCTQNGDTWAVKSEYKTKYGIKNCCTDSDCISKGDYWASAMVECKDMGGHLATLTDLAKIATYLYDAPQIGYTARYDGTLNTSKLGTTFAGLGSSWSLWSSSEVSAGTAYFRAFNSSSTNRGVENRRRYSLRALCVKD
ncbi:hypothetical protein J6G99_04860, partial [bacterium]|nr:hypothetical protein [bacterium]